MRVEVEGFRIPISVLDDEDRSNKDWDLNSRVKEKSEQGGMV